MKKIICIAIAAVTICVFFAACSNSSVNESSVKQGSTVTEAQTQKSTTDLTVENYGNTAENQVHAYACGSCGGSGQIYAPIFDANGIPIQEYIMCGSCGGTGWIYY